MPLQVLCIGAHPDDCEGSVGGTAVRYRERGDEVTFVSVTDGSRGHYAQEYRDHLFFLVRRRRDESVAAARIGDVRFRNLGLRDGEVYVDKESTEAMIRLIRGTGEPTQGPDVVLLNRPCDYHRDHRYTAQLVLDASYMLTVPYLCPDVPALRRMPVFAYWGDTFTESGAFRPDVVVPIDTAIVTKRDMMLAHASQYLEWLPYNAGPGTPLGDLPLEPVARIKAAGEVLVERSRRTANAYRDRLPEGTRFAEAFQISEYGRQLAPEEHATFFPI
ncbi:MAG: PIG-L deacetylase family protein [Fimbriimonas sp.]